jgi:hypothetical protein
VSRPLDSCERSDVSDDEHQAVKVASHAALTRGGAIQRPVGVRSIALTITAIKACLGLAVGTAVGLLGLHNPVHNTHGEMRPVGSTLRLFGEGSRAGTYFIWSPGSCR